MKERKITKIKDKLEGVKWKIISFQFFIIQRKIIINQKVNLRVKETKGQPEKESQLPLNPQMLKKRTK